MTKLITQKLCTQLYSTGLVNTKFVLACLWMKIKQITIVSEHTNDIQHSILIPCTGADPVSPSLNWSRSRIFATLSLFFSLLLANVRL